MREAERREDAVGALGMNLEGGSRGGEFGMSSVSCGNGKLRQWLIDQIDSGKYPGLVWENEEKSIFRIPWKHAGKQDYNREEDAALFKVTRGEPAGVRGARGAPRPAPGPRGSDGRAAGGPRAGAVPAGRPGRGGPWAGPWEQRSFTFSSDFTHGGRGASRILNPWSEQHPGARGGQKAPAAGGTWRPG